MQLGEELIRKMPETIIRWYNFEKEADILFVQGGFDEFECIGEIGYDTISASDLDTLEKKYDYVIIAGIIEKNDNPVLMLKKLYRHLTENGKLLIVAQNRLAIKNFVGEKDYFTNRAFDGVMGYLGYSPESIEKNGGRTYSKAELDKFINEAGFVYSQCLGVYPDIVKPQMLIGEGYIPNESLDIRLVPFYRSPETVFLQEDKIYNSLAENELLVKMANGFFIECSKNDLVHEISQVSLSSERDNEKALATIIVKNGKVIKKALFPEGRKRLEELASNQEYLLNHNVPMVAGTLQNDTFVMPFIKGDTVLEYFRKIFLVDREELIAKIEYMYQVIINSSEHVDYKDINWEQFEPGWEKRKDDDPNRYKWQKLAQGSEEDRNEIGVILKRGYIELFSINSIYSDGKILFFDQEEYMENLPAKAILMRTINILYHSQPDFERIMPLKEMAEHFGLEKNIAVWRKFEGKFLEKLRNENELRVFDKKHRVDYQTMRANRMRMNYSQETYDSLFSNIFSNVSDKKLYIFGTGRFASSFIRQYADTYEIAGAVDNNSAKWNTEFEGIRITSPDELLKIDEPFKVFVCIKDYRTIIDQLLAMNIKDIAVYDPSIQQVVNKLSVGNINLNGSEKKKYGIGYVAGVFDMFHRGHLNLLKRAKEQCECLIVGVVSDEQVIKEKKTSPVIPYEDRAEIVKGCRYVDEVVMIPIDNPGTEYAWRTYRFDAQFSGSDYENDPVWLAQKEFLNQHGADLVFFPYTESVSSTKLKQQLH